MRLDKIIARGRIVDLKSLDLEGALQELLDVCVKNFPDLKPDALLKGLLARESTMTTYLGFGVALPHVRIKMSRRYILAIGRSRIGIRHDGALADERVEQDVQKMVNAFRARRDHVVSRFRAEVPGIEYVEPHGAFYFFFRVDGIVPNDPVTGQVFCERLMQQEGVALVPGGAFGDDRWVRLSYSVSDQELDQALDRIIGFIKTLASARAA